MPETPAFLYAEVRLRRMEFSSSFLLLCCFAIKLPERSSNALHSCCLRFIGVKKPILDLQKALMGAEGTPRPARKTWPYWLLAIVILGAVLGWFLLAR